MHKYCLVNGNLVSCYIESIDCSRNILFPLIFFAFKIGFSLSTQLIEKFGKQVENFADTFLNETIANR